MSLWAVYEQMQQEETQENNLLVLSREWMGMVEWDDYY
jgi:hypothetical protein